MKGINLTKTTRLIFLHPDLQTQRHTFSFRFSAFHPFYFTFRFSGRPEVERARDKNQSQEAGEEIEKSRAGLIVLELLTCHRCVQVATKSTGEAETRIKRASLFQAVSCSYIFFTFLVFLVCCDVSFFMWVLLIP